MSVETSYNQYPDQKGACVLLAPFEFAVGLVRLSRLRRAVRVRLSRSGLLGVTRHVDLRRYDSSP